MRPPPENAGRWLLEAEDRFAGLVTWVEPAEDHTVVRYSRAPTVSGGNHFRAVALPAGTSAEAWLHARLDDAGEWGWPVCRFELDDRTFPANLGDVLGAADFLPQVFAGLVAHTGDVPAPATFMLVRGATLSDPTDATFVHSLLASKQREARVPLAIAQAKLDFTSARLGHPGMRVMLAQLDESPAGLIGYLVNDDVAYVRQLYVTSAARGRGVATALLHAVAQRTAAPLIGCFAQTTTGLPEFYRARGFAAVTRRETWTRVADVLDADGIESGGSDEPDSAGHAEEAPGR